MVEVGLRHPRALPGPLLRISTSTVLAGLLRDPLGSLERAAARADGGLIRLNLGLFRPYLVSNPRHVQHVLADNAINYRRKGMLWRPIRRLIGHGLGSDGPGWAASRELLQPVFAAKNLASMVDLTVDTVAKAVAELAQPYRVEQHAGRPVGKGREPAWEWAWGPEWEWAGMPAGGPSGVRIDAAIAMARIVNRAVGRAFFGARISTADADRLGIAVSRAFSSLVPRMVVPLVPDSVPMPGSRTFRRAVRTVDNIIYPLIERCRVDGGPAGTGRDDLVSMLCRARNRYGVGLSDRQIRDHLVSIFVGGSETTAAALTWLWVMLDRHPPVAAAVRQEVDRAPALGRLPYTRMVLQELLRLYPSGWVIPRRAERADHIDGVRITPGSTLLVSPYLTHRCTALWDRPAEFRPERFTPDQIRQRQRFAYLPFGVGAHQCLGSQFFMVEAQLIVAMMLNRYRIRVRDSASITPRPAVALRPNRPVELLLNPARGR